MIKCLGVIVFTSHQRQIDDTGEPFFLLEMRYLPLKGLDYRLCIQDI